ncbi:MAG: tetratricopeptide repeat protein [Proteobacteria bacterium]|nr:tetratricopeptide repeat protein [Pseudomonadota bacterium]
MSENNFKIKTVFLTALILFAILSLSGCAGSDRYIKTGNELIDNNEWDKSVSYLRAAKKKYPGNTEIELLLFRAEWNASMIHMERGETLLKDGQFDDAIEALKTSMSFNADNQKSKLLVKKAEGFKESHALATRAEQLMQSGDYAKARQVAEKSLQLNPENQAAQKLLSYFKSDEKISPQDGMPPKYQLELRSTAPISLKFKKTPIVNVFEVLAKLSGINFIFDKDMKETMVTLFMTDVSFDRFIDVLLRTNDLAARIINEKTMLIYPDTPDKTKEYEDLQVRTFYLNNIDSPKMVSLLSKILKNNDMSANEKLNTIVIRGTSEVIELASRIINANDRTPAEVLLNVEILEVKREKEKQLGLEFSDSVSLGIGATSETISTETSKASFASLYSLDSLSNKELLLSLPTATINLLKRDGDTKILAKPQIRVKNLEKAFIHVGDRVPIRSNRKIDTSGNETYDYAYQDVGIKLETMPVINMQNEISLTLSLEVSGLGSNVGTVSDPQYSIRTRNAKTVLTMQDGEVIVIGGLISDEERENIKKIPLLGSIPIFGSLFSNFDTNNSETDILMVITPYVIKTQEIPDRDMLEVWSGKERNFSLREPYESAVKKEKAYQAYPNEAWFRNQNQLKTVPAGPDEKQDRIVPELSGKQQDSMEDARLQTDDAAMIKDEESDDRILDTPDDQRAGNQKENHTAGTEPSGTAWAVSMPYSIHVNSYLKKKHADDRVNELSALNYDAFLVFAEITGKGAYYRVFVGRFKSMDDAKNTCSIYRKKEEFAKDIYVMARWDAFGG